MLAETAYAVAEEAGSSSSSSNDPTHAWPPPRTVIAFVIVALAAASISGGLRKHLHLPLITGYILAGILCGPYMVGLLQASECKLLVHLVTNDAMGFIGFSAGSKFLLSELRGPALKAILSLLVGLVTVTYVLVFTCLYLLSPYLELTSKEDPHNVIAICLLIACLAVARSPSSAIALVSELSAYGPFTTAALSLTVLTDVVVVLMFALTLLVVNATAPVEGAAPPSVGVVLGLFAMQMAISCAVGALLGLALHGFIYLTSSGVAAAIKGAEPSLASATSEAQKPLAPAPAPAPPATASKPNGQTDGSTAPGARPKARPLRRFNSVVAAAAHTNTASAAAAEALVRASNAASGALVAAPQASNRRRAALVAVLWLGAKLGLMLTESLVMQATGFEIFQTEEFSEEAFGRSFHQPLVISMVAGFLVVNFTSSRRPLLRILHDSSEPVYIAFFTLTGMTLQLESLVANLSTAVLIWALRFVGVVLGSYWGGRLGGSEPQHYERYWMVFLTQAGVTLGLAQRIAGQYPTTFGPSLATCVTAVVVLNQLIGPLLFKAAIIGVGEAHGSYSPGNGPLGVTPPTRPKPRNGVVVAAQQDPEATALCARLASRGWSLSRCDALFPHPGPQKTPGLEDGASARREERLSTLAKGTSDPRLAARLHPLIAATSGAPAAEPVGRAAHAAGVGGPSRVGALAEPLLAGRLDPEGGGLAEDALTELHLLWAIAGLESLDTLVLLLPTDDETIRVLRLLGSASALLPLVHQRQTSMPQVVVRLVDPSSEATVLAQAALHLSAFEVTPVVEGAALPNLLAEVLHPDCHWTKKLDNSPANVSEYLASLDNPSSILQAPGSRSG